MFKEKSLTVTPNYEEDIKFSRVPLISSNQASWNGIGIEYHYQPPGEVLSHCDEFHEINIPHFQHPQLIEGTIDGQYQSSYISTGEIAIVPANLSHSLSWNADVEYTIITLDPSLFARIAYESTDLDNIELVPHFGKPDPLVYQIGIALKSLLESNTSSVNRLYAESTATMLVAHLIQHYSVNKSPIESVNNASGLPKYKLRRVIEYINDHLADDISLEAIAKEVNMSQYHFARLFKQSMAISAHQYVIRRRVEVAKQLLKQGNLNITDIAFQVGFANPSHLSHHFKRLVGVTPKMFLSK
jgi:AraC family transcriptional regulator